MFIFANPLASIRRRMILSRGCGGEKKGPQSKKYECCGQTFNTKEELEAHKEKYHEKGCCR